MSLLEWVRKNRPRDLGVKDYIDIKERIDTKKRKQKNNHQLSNA